MSEAERPLRPESMSEAAHLHPKTYPSPETPWRALPLKLIVLVGVVVALSVLLVPRGVELASLRVRFGHADSAVVLLERAVADGDRSAATIGALARARTLAGDLAGSIELLRELVAARPHDVAALQSLANMYREAGRTREYRDALEQLQLRSPSAARQTVLARLYVEEGSPDQQMAALHLLIDRFGRGEVADHLRLARLQSAHGAPERALVTLDRMESRYPASSDASVVAARMSALLKIGEVDAAMELGRARLRAHPKALGKEAPLLAGVLGIAGRPDLGAALLEPYRAEPHAGARILAAWAQAQSDCGHPELALAAISRLDSDEGENADLLRLKVGLALTTGKLDMAAQAAQMLGAEHLPPALRAELAAAALTADRNDVLRLAYSGAEDGLGAQHPVLAARAALALGDQQAALRWSDAAMAGKRSDATSTLQLAGLLHRMGRQAEALAVLRVVPLHETSAIGLIAYARLSIALGQATVALPQVADLRREQSGVEIDEAWALLATAGRKYGEVLNWFNRAGDRSGSAEVLRDVLHMAMDGKAYALALAAGQILLRGTDRDGDRLLLANALLAAGRAPEAVTQFRILMRRGSVGDDSYSAALLAAWKQGAPVADELRRVLLDRLARGGARKAQREADISMLLALGAHAELLPTLESLALTEPQRWLGVFAEAAANAGERGRLLEVWKRVAEGDATSETLRAQLAFRLLEAGEKRGAERVFRALATTAPADHAATHRLLFVWGPRPSKEQLDWLEARAADATGDERGAWMRLLTERGAAARAIAVYRNTEPLPGSVAIDDAFLDAVVAQGNKSVLAAAIRELATRARQPAQLGRLAQQAQAVGDQALERRLLESAIAAGNADPKLLRALGLLAFEMRDAAAQSNLKAFNERTGGDVETHRAVGSIRLKQRDIASARSSFERALEALELGGDDRYESRVVKAGLLQQLERTAEARRLYRALLSERPGDDNVRADYAALLLGAGDAPEAQNLLAAK